ncbi:hypothetical protein BASA81_002629 [Batrachochytrium salamandrivorans]|nr:hypothetical protein BASA81_002629 [Batrachochytrium salamandrivorans]
MMETANVIVNSDHRVRDKQGHFRCPICHAGFANFPPFYRHQKTHGTLVFQCPECALCLEEPFYLKIHIQRVHRSSS